MGLEDSQTGAVQSIKELEEALLNPNLSQDERKKLKRRLKKKRQKERKRTGDAGEVVGDEEDDDDEEEEEEDDDGDVISDSGSFLSDMELSRMLSMTSNIVAARTSDSGIVPATGTVKRRLKHSAFVTSNFGHRLEQADAKLMGLLQTAIDIRRPSSKEFASDFTVATQESGGGIAEVAFMLRAFTPEEELADGVSTALGGIPWEMSGDKSKREW
jgi:hypothetical protein